MATPLNIAPTELAADIAAVALAHEATVEDILSALACLMANKVMEPNDSLTLARVVDAHDVEVEHWFPSGAPDLFTPARNAQRYAC